MKICFTKIEAIIIYYTRNLYTCEYIYISIKLYHLSIAEFLIVYKYQGVTKLPNCVENKFIYSAQNFGVNLRFFNH